MRLSLTRILTGLVMVAALILGGTQACAQVTPNPGMTGVTPPLGSGVAAALANAVNTSTGLPTITTGTWTPTCSGCTFGSATGNYIVMGSMVFVDADITWPTTADGTAVNIGGLPFTPASVGGLAVGFQTYTTAVELEVYSGGIAMAAAGGGGSVTNANVSTKRFIFSGTYRK